MKAGEQEIKYPIGIQSFRKMIMEGYLYVDKTPFVYDFIRDGGYYFLSRPRRFGKSLLLSTIEAYYRGERELFRGLALENLVHEWETLPVLHLDLNNGSYEDEQGLLEKLDFQLSEWEEEFGISYDSSRSLSASLRFGSLIKKIHDKTGKMVVILVDEYDKPLLNTIHRPELSDSFRTILKAFYSNLKTMDVYIRLAVLTGVARFSKVSIFSDLNNLRDISFEDRYSEICGVTKRELERYFQSGIRELQQTYNLGNNDIEELLKKKYDGYHFSRRSSDIYNPFSLMNVFAKRHIGNYWIESGTPTYLVNLLRMIDRPFRDVTPVEVETEYLESAGIMDSDPIIAFYQSGYLTIKGYDPDTSSYILDYPNEEVKDGFLKFLLRSYIPKIKAGSGFTLGDFIRFARDGQPQEFMKSLESMVASVPYTEKGSAESHFQNVIYLLFTLLGFSVSMEERTSDGRIDLRVQTPGYVYIFEFKVDSSAEIALRQIREKKYWTPYAASGKEIFLIGANFDTKSRRLTDYLIATPE